MARLDLTRHGVAVDDLRIDYYPPSVRAERRAIGIDLRTIQHFRLAGEIELRFDDRCGAGQQVAMPAAMAFALKLMLDRLFDDPIVKEQLQNGRPDTAADLESFIIEALGG
jgi:hypothetical protein